MADLSSRTKKRIADSYNLGPGVSSAPNKMVRSLSRNLSRQMSSKSIRSTFGKYKVKKAVVQPVVSCCHDTAVAPTKKEKKHIKKNDIKDILKPYYLEDKYIEHQKEGKNENIPMSLWEDFDILPS